MLDRLGGYDLVAQHFRQDNKQTKPSLVALSYGSVARPYAEEFFDLSPRRDELQAWAQLSEGGLDISPSVMWSAQGESVTRFSSRKTDLVWLALALFFADLLIRRVRVFDRNFSQQTNPKMRSSSVG